MVDILGGLVWDVYLNWGVLGVCIVEFDIYYNIILLLSFVFLIGKCVSVENIVYCVSLVF